MRIGINGLGRIGRVVFRNLINSRRHNLLLLNDLMPIETLAYLLKYDSVHGIWDKRIRIENNSLFIDDLRIEKLNFSDPQDIPWNDFNIDVVIESSGKFKTRERLCQHLKPGVKRVILSCPSDDNLDNHIVIGVNEKTLIKEHQIISNASCTTNCLGPVIKILDHHFGFSRGFINTVHPFTNNQSILDAPHPDLRRSRSLGVNIIPTTSTAIEAILQVMPELKGKLDGLATRVPVKDGALIEITAQLLKKTSVSDLNNIFELESQNKYQGILEYSAEPLVSADIIGNPHSVIFDSLSTKVIGGDMIQLVVWYDNEFGYSSRIVDLIELGF